MSQEPRISAPAAQVGAAAVRRHAQTLISAFVHDSDKLDDLLDEAAELHPEETLSCLIDFIAIHTADVNRHESDIKGLLEFVARASLRGLKALGSARGGDIHEYLRSTLSAASGDHDAHHIAAQTLLATALIEDRQLAEDGQRTFEGVLTICVPAWGRCIHALLDIWYTACLDALTVCPTQAMFITMLQAIQEVITGLADYAGCSVAQMLESYWMTLVESDCMA